MAGEDSDRRMVRVSCVRRVDVEACATIDVAQEGKANQWEEKNSYELLKKNELEDGGMGVNNEGKGKEEGRG